MRLIIDTNRYADLVRGAEAVVETVQSADAVSVPFVVLAELQVGFKGGNQRARNEQRLKEFLEQPQFGVLYPDEHTVDLYSDLPTYLHRRGTPIPVHDVWIAALALQHGMTLYARDKHFDHLPQLARV